MHLLRSHPDRVQGYIDFHPQSFAVHFKLGRICALGVYAAFLVTVEDALGRKGHTAVGAVLVVRVDMVCREE
jgi:hypothetical protein